MKNLFVILCFLISSVVHSAVHVEIAFLNNRVKQGSIEKALIRMESGSAQKLNLQKLQGVNIAETLFISDVAPLVKSQGKSVYESEVEVIVIKAPAEDSLKYDLDGLNVVFKWNDFEFIPTETPQELLYGDFEIPKSKEIALWLILAFVIIAGALLTWKLLHRKRIINHLRKQKQDAKLRLLEASDYNEIVLIWRNKHEYLMMFPQLKEPLHLFEKTLFKYQFKPFQTEPEQQEVLKAYKEFIIEIRESLNGI